VRPPGNAAYIDASPCTATFGVPKNFGWDAAAVPLEVPSPVRGFNNATGAIANLGCIQSRADGSDVVAIRRVSSLVTPVASLSASSVYVQAAQCATDPLLFKAGNDAATLDQKTFACVAGTVAPIREYFVRVYYLSTCNICSPSDNIPTLKRTEIRNGSISHTSLAEGVIGMQFEYGFDTTVAPGDGVPDVYLSNIDPDATKPEGRWSNVVSIRAHLLVRSVDPAMNAVVGTRTFALGPDQPAATCTAGYRCRLVTTTLRLNNVAGSREVP
jgi:type IV pilus assembly protein PilW